MFLHTNKNVNSHNTRLSSTLTISVRCQRAPLYGAFMFISVQHDRNHH